MYTEDNYLWGMVGYYLGAFIVLWYVHYLLAKIAIRHVRNGLLIVAATLLLTPVQAYPDPQLYQLAPAFLVYFFEGAVYAVADDPNRGLIPMVFVFILLSAAYLAWLWWLNRRQVLQQTDSADESVGGSPTRESQTEKPQTKNPQIEEVQAGGQRH